MTNVPQAPAAPFIPKAGDVKIQSGGKGYRFSKGRIVTGREDDGTLVVHDAIVGIVTRIGIHSGKVKDHNRPYLQVEADMMTADGEIHVHAGLLDNETFELRPTQAALSFAWCLTQVQGPEDVIVLKASQGEAWKDEMGRAREASTYVNLFRVQGDTAKPVFRPKVDQNAPKVTSVEKWQALEAQLRAHPLFAARPETDERDDDGGESAQPTQLQALSAYAKSQGWPTAEEDPGTWLALYNSVSNQPPLTTLAAVPDEHWQALLAGLTQWIARQNGQLPPLLKAAVEKRNGASAPMDFGGGFGSDPFADKPKAAAA